MMREKYRPGLFDPYLVEKDLDLWEGFPELMLDLGYEMDCEHSFDVYRKSSKLKQKEGKADREEKRNILYEEYFERYDKYIKERGRMDAYMRTAAERIFLWKRYYPYKDRIVRLFKDKRIDELRLVFGKMENSIKKYEAFGFLCIFDKEIWSVYIKMLKTEGYKERAKQLEKLYEDNPFKELTNEELLLQFENTGNNVYWRNIK